MSAQGVKVDADANPNTDVEQRQEHRREFHSYVWGIGLALCLTVVPFALVQWELLSRNETLATLGVLAFIQVVVHFRFFLHIDLAKQQREDLQLILFSALLLIIMCSGTIWIMADLAGRMGGHTM